VSGDYFEEEEFRGPVQRQNLAAHPGLTRPHWKIMIGFLVAILAVAGPGFAVSPSSASRSSMKASSPRNTRCADQYLTCTAADLVQAVMVFAFIYMVGILGERIRFDLRQRMFNHLQDLSLSYYSRTPVGWIMARVTSDSDRVAELVTWGLLDSAWGVMSISPRWPLCSTSTGKWR
jgi:ATP-binding cassette, subfamily B, bacterial